MKHLKPTSAKFYQDQIGERDPSSSCSRPLWQSMMFSLMKDIMIIPPDYRDLLGTAGSGAGRRDRHSMCMVRQYANAATAQFEKVCEGLRLLVLTNAVHTDKHCLPAIVLPFYVSNDVT